MPDPPERKIVRRHFDTDGENPGIQVARVVAELEETDPADLTGIYGCVDGVLDRVFSNPPAPEANLKTEFSYEGYRITVEQDGTAEFVKTG